MNHLGGTRRVRWLSAANASCLSCVPFSCHHLIGVAVGSGTRQLVEVTRSVNVCLVVLRRLLVSVLLCLCVASLVLVRVLLCLFPRLRLIMQWREPFVRNLAG